MVVSCVHHTRKLTEEAVLGRLVCVPRVWKPESKKGNYRIAYFS